MEFLENNETVKKIIRLVDAEKQVELKELLEQLLNDYSNARFKRKAEKTRLKKENIKMIKEVKAGKETIKKACELLGIGRTTFYELRKKYDEVQEQEQVKTKICSRCGLEKPLSEFTVNSYNENTKKPYLKPFCNKCRSEHRTDQ